MGSYVKVGCTCGSPSRSWRDHASTCPFARLAESWARTDAITRRVGLALCLGAGLLVCTALYVLAIR